MTSDSPFRDHLGELTNYGNKVPAPSTRPSRQLKPRRERSASGLPREFQNHAAAAVSNPRDTENHYVQSFPSFPVVQPSSSLVNASESRDDNSCISILDQDIIIARSFGRSLPDHGDLGKESIEIINMCSLRE